MLADHISPLMHVVKFYCSITTINQYYVCVFVSDIIFCHCGVVDDCQIVNIIMKGAICDILEPIARQFPYIEVSVLYVQR